MRGPEIASRFRQFHRCMHAHHVSTSCTERSEGANTEVCQQAYKVCSRYAGRDACCLPDVEQHATELLEGLASQRLGEDVRHVVVRSDTTSNDVASLDELADLTVTTLDVLRPVVGHVVHGHVDGALVVDEHVHGEHVDACENGTSGLPCNGTLLGKRHIHGCGTCACILPPSYC